MSDRFCSAAGCSRTATAEEVLRKMAHALSTEMAADLATTFRSAFILIDASTAAAVVVDESTAIVLGKLTSGANVCGVTGITCLLTV